MLSYSKMTKSWDLVLFFLIGYIKNAYSLNAVSTSDFKGHLFHDRSLLHTELGWHSSNNEICSYRNLKNLVLESHHSSGKNNLNATGIMFWTILHFTCCLLKMSLDRACTNKPRACPCSLHQGSRLQVTLGGERWQAPWASAVPALSCSQRLGTIIITTHLWLMHVSAKPARKLRKQCGKY